MKLDPSVERLVAAFPMQTDYGLSTSIQELRRQTDNDGQATQHPDVDVVENRVVPGPDGGPGVPIRIYAPQSTSRLPVLMYFHGGGFSTGSLTSHDGLCRTISRDTGYAVVAVEYRLSPEDPYPAGVEDCYAALQWVSSNADRLGADQSRIAVIGDSAGGGLAAAVTMLARDRQGPRLSLQVLWYPFTDSNTDYPSFTEFANAPIASPERVRWNWQKYLANVPADKIPPYAVPMQADDLTGLPPAYIVTAECDPVRDCGEAYAARLVTAGVPVTFRRYPGMVHGFIQLLDVLPAGRSAADETFAFLRTVMSSTKPAGD